MLRRVVDRVGCSAPPGFIELPAARVEIAIEPREVAAGDLQPQAVTRQELICGGLHVHAEFVDPSLSHQDLSIETLTVAGAQHSLLDIEGAAIRINIDQFCGEIGIRRIGRYVKDQLDRPHHGERLGENLAIIDKHVCTCLHASLIERAGGQV